MTEQRILTADHEYADLDRYLQELEAKKLFLVCGRSIQKLRLNEYIETLGQRLGIDVVRFSGFHPNPDYDSAAEGTRLFRESGADLIMAVGGGSALDVAKCIKLYANMDPDQNYLKQKIVPNEIPLLAVPTTSGTGSEATRFAVIYYQGVKQSVADESIIPSAVLIDPSVIHTLPDYHRKATMMDAFCHAVESIWSVNSNETSRKYAKEALTLILENQEGYLNNEDAANAAMLRAANLAGKAINITQTTAGHAMAYKLTSLYGVAHGHAAALCVSRLWPYMLEHPEPCADPRGQAYVRGVFDELAAVMQADTPQAGAAKFRAILDGLDLPQPQASEADYEVLRTSVNPDRLKNNPVRLDEETIERLYRDILSDGGQTGRE